jgi:hypothetical protein
MSSFLFRFSVRSPSRSHCWVRPPGLYCADNSQNVSSEKIWSRGEPPTRGTWFPETSGNSDAQQCHGFVGGAHFAQPVKMFQHVLADELPPSCVPPSKDEARSEAIWRSNSPIVFEGCGQGNDGRMGREASNPDKIPIKPSACPARAHVHPYQCSACQ